MPVNVVQRCWLPASGVLLIAGLILQPLLRTDRLHGWSSPSRTPAARPPVGADAPAPAPARSRVVAEGRVVAYPGAEVVVGAEVTGRIVRLPVEEKSAVRKGDLIAELNSADLRASLAQAKSAIAEADADIRFFERESRRDGALLARGATTPQNMDVNRRGLDTALARRAAAAATCDHFEALIAKTRITSPIDGVVTARHVQPGEMVRGAAPIVTVADLGRVRIEAEVDEFDAARVALGAPVTITSEGFGPATWRGTVEEIPDTVVGRRLRPGDPGRPIDARVLPVKLAFGGPTPLKLGQRIDVEIAPPESTPR